MGNICRSPVAEGIFLHLIRERGIADQFTVDSAAIGDWHLGFPADPRSQEVSRRNGIELACTSRQVDRTRDFETFDWIIGMDRQNFRDLENLSPREHLGKIRLIREFDPLAEKGAEVDDPYFGGPEGFDSMYTILRRSCEHFLDTITR
jgi:protein-tyrosine phosphatase